MRKKYLLAEMDKLIAKNDDLFAENSELKIKLAALEEKIGVLEARIEEMNTQSAEDTALTKEYEDGEEALPDNAALETNEEITDLDKSSAAIGRVVLRSAEICDTFAKSGNENAKDLINLALGRTEVFKSEMLNAVTEKSGEPIDDIILHAEAEVYNYFESLKGQIEN